MRLTLKISRGHAYLIASLLLDLLGAVLCGLVAYFCFRSIYVFSQQGIGLENVYTFIVILSTAWFIAVLSTLIYELPSVGMIFRREDGMVRCKYLIHGREIKLITVIDIKKYWMRRDTRYKIRFFDENNRMRNIMVSVKMKYSNVQILWDMLQPMSVDEPMKGTSERCRGEQC